jgi:hypothetical protein
MAKTLLCVTCHRPLPEDEEYPKFFGQEHLEFDLTSQDHVRGELHVVFDYLEAVCDVIPEAVDVGERTVRNLARLALDLTEEARRRTERLAEARTCQRQTEKEG